MVVAYTDRSQARAARSRADNWTSILQRRRRRDRTHRSEPRAGRLSHAAHVPARRAVLQAARVRDVAADRAPERNIRPNAAELAALLAGRRAGLHLRLSVGRRVERLSLHRAARRRSTSATRNRGRDTPRSPFACAARRRGTTSTFRGQPILYGLTHSDRRAARRAARALRRVPRSRPTGSGAPRRARRHARPPDRRRHRRAATPWCEPGTSVAGTAPARRRAPVARRVIVGRRRAVSSVFLLFLLAPVAGLVGVGRRARRWRASSATPSCARRSRSRRSPRPPRRSSACSAARRSRTCSRAALPRHARCWRRCIDLPLVIPHPVAGIALLLVLGRGSAVGGALYAAGLRVAGSPTGIVCAMLFVSAPLYVSAAREAFARVDARYEIASRARSATTRGARSAA